VASTKIHAGAGCCPEAHELVVYRANQPGRLMCCSRLSVPPINGPRHIINSAAQSLRILHCSGRIADACYVRVSTENLHISEEKSFALSVAEQMTPTAIRPARGKAQRRALSVNTLFYQFFMTGLSYQDCCDNAGNVACPRAFFPKDRAFVFIPVPCAGARSPPSAADENLTLRFSSDRVGADGSTPVIRG
jgi:hypothetical protein